jgi:uncharacterized damage-inducible protein DinB
MSVLIKTIKNQLKHSYSGTPWFGSPVKQVIADITWKQAVARPIANAHTIMELLLHMLAWRKFVLERLQGNTLYNIELNTAADWPSQDGTEEQFNNTLKELDEVQERLLAALDKVTEDLLPQMVDGKDFTINIMLQGVVQHDIYHLGQIGLLKKC